MISYDSNGNLLEGGKRYQLNLPSDIPASNFWSIIVYDSLSRLMIHTDQPWPAVFSSNKNLVYRTSGSLDVWFGPEPVTGKESNWVKTIPGNHYHVILRLYYPLESWFENRWRPGEIIEIK